MKLLKHTFPIKQPRSEDRNLSRTQSTYTEKNKCVKTPPCLTPDVRVTGSERQSPHLTLIDWLLNRDFHVFRMCGLIPLFNSILRTPCARVLSNAFLKSIIPRLTVLPY